MKTEIGQDIDRAISFLKKGETVAIPTETVYGLAADATNEDAVLKIFEAKGRPTSNPLILHFPSVDSIFPYVAEFPETLLNSQDIIVQVLSPSYCQKVRWFLRS